MNTKIYVVFYSMYGHVYKLAEAIAAGANEEEGVEAQLFQLPELVPNDALRKSGAFAARHSFAHTPVIAPKELADALIFGTRSRCGLMTAQM